MTSQNACKTFVNGHAATLPHSLTNGSKAVYASANEDTLIDGLTLCPAPLKQSSTNGSTSLQILLYDQDSQGCNTEVEFSLNHKFTDICYDRVDAPETENMLSAVRPPNEDVGSTRLLDDAPCSTKRDKGPPRWRSQRYILAYFIFGGMMNVFLHRITLSIAIICMVNHTAISLQANPPYANSQLESILLDPNIHSSRNLNQSAITSLELSLVEKVKVLNTSTDRNGDLALNIPDTTDVQKYTVEEDLNKDALTKGESHDTMFNNESVYDQCAPGYVTENEKKEDGPLVWDKQTQGLLLGALYWGYIFVLMPGNLLLRNFKRRNVIIAAMFVMATSSILCHMCALWSPWALFVIRTIQGCCTGLLIISLYGAVQKWAPPAEKAGLISVAWSGQMFANVAGFPLAALLCDYGFLDGWQSIFYVFGVITMIWVILFALFTSESPDENKFITETEREYIMSSLPVQPTLDKLPPTPWSSIITSAPFWGIVCCHCSFTFGMILQLSTMPQYLYEVLKLDIKSNGLLSMLPYTALLIATQAAGQMSDLLVRRKLLRLIWTRKLCVIIGNFFPAVLLIALSFVGCTQPELAITLLTMAVSLEGFSLSGFLVNPMDVAPRFASQLLTLSNTFAAIPGVIVPFVVSAITVDQSREQWQIVFFLTAAVLVVGMLGFCILARGEIQLWATDSKKVIDFVIVVNSPLNGDTTLPKE